MKQAQVRKPAIATGAAMDFITGAQIEKSAGQGADKGKAKKTAHKAAIKANPERVFFAPEGDRRLTINLREDLHKKLKVAAVEQESTAGEIIEQLIAKYL